ncbi:MAG TPA: GyrI-like domain-containing protein [Anaerolineae bacterium]|nr:GyrI-like domain-containing protein [Anaerolineae bacterium]
MPKPKLTDPRFVKKSKQKMAVVVGKGDPNDVLPRLMPALYGTVYGLKFALKKAGKETFKVGALFGRWPDAHLLPKSEWTGIYGLPIPSSTRKLLQKDASVEVKIEMWDYGGVVAEIMHIGPYAAEGPTIQRLHEFIEREGYEIAGVHEEEYLTSPRAKVQKTIIRYPVRKRKAKG